MHPTVFVLKNTCPEFPANKKIQLQKKLPGGSFFISK